MSHLVAEMLASQKPEVTLTQANRTGDSEKTGNRLIEVDAQSECYRIILLKFSPKSLISWLIALATQSQFTHAAIQCVRTGVICDSSELRGSFDVASPAGFVGRDAWVIEFEGDLRNWFMQMQGVQYDYAGVLGWMRCKWFSKWCGQKGKFYCFEAALFALTGNVPDKAVSGFDVLESAKKLGLSAKVGHFNDAGEFVEEII